MDYRIVYDSDGIIRIEDDTEAAVTVQYSGDTARLLSILVPDGLRKNGSGLGLMSAAEYVLSRRGVRLVEADYSDALKDVTGLLKRAGYHISVAAHILSADVKELLLSDKIQKIMNTEADEAEFITFLDIPASKWDDMTKLFDELELKLTSLMLAGFSQEFSGIVCDKNGKCRALMLCSEKQGSIHIELLAATSKGNSEFILPAFSELLKEINLRGGSKKYTEITFITDNPHVISILEKILPKDHGPEEIGFSMFAEKRLKKDSATMSVITYDIDEDKSDDWQREIKKIDFQSNITFKMPWISGDETGALFAEVDRKI